MEIALHSTQVQESDCIIQILSAAGVPPSSLKTASLESRERGLSSIYRLTDGKSEVRWIKFSGARGSSGSFFIKNSVDPDEEVIEHGKYRREVMRELILGINNLAKRQLLTSPLPLDSEGKSFEYSVDSSLVNLEATPHLAGTHMTLWQHVPGERPVRFFNSFSVYDPCAYEVKTLRTLVCALLELQKLSQKWLSLQLDPEKIKFTLSHEDRKLIGYEPLKDLILNSLGLDGEPEVVKALLHDPTSSIHEKLRSTAKSRLEEIERKKVSIAEKLEIDTSTDLEALAQIFLKNQLPPWTTALVESEKRRGVDSISFQQAVFCAEREKIWPTNILLLGRRIAQLLLAKEVAENILNKDAALVLSLLSKLCDLKESYTYTEKFPSGIVHHDPHPAQFHIWNGEPSILDLNNISYDIGIADISNVYVYKIVRAYVQKSISREKAIELLNAVLIPEWVGKDGIHLLSYNIASFWNQGIHLARCFELKQKDTPRVNLAVSLQSFLNELENRSEYDRVYRELFPELAIANH